MKTLDQVAAALTAVLPFVRTSNFDSFVEAMQMDGETIVPDETWEQFRRFLVQMEIATQRAGGHYAAMSRPLGE